MDPRTKFPLARRKLLAKAEDLSPPDEGDPEVKIEAWSGFTNEVDSAFMDPEKTSSWAHLLRVTAWVHKFIVNYRRPRTGLDRNSGPLSVKELVSAEEFWIKGAQAQAYPDDLARLKENKELHRSSNLRSLSPYVDEKGVLFLLRPDTPLFCPGSILWARSSYHTYTES